VLIEAPAADIEAVVATARATMAEASRVVLSGFEVGTDVKIVRGPERYVDEAAGELWNTVLRMAGPLDTAL
jgi:hypothetical protein